MWSLFEVSKDEYDYTEIDTYLDYAKKYNLTLSLLWYGSFVDGETHTVNVPNYIIEDPTTYPLYQY